MIRYRVGICDDDISVAAGLENSIYRYFQNKEDNVDVEIWTSGENCIKDLSGDLRYNALFLDIELPCMNGVDVGNYIRNELSECTMQIVYISAKTSYAMDLFQTHPFDFLVKPFSDERVYDILDKLLQYNKQDSGMFRYTSHGVENAVRYKDILYIESNDKHLAIHLTDGSVKTYVGKLGNETDKLPEWFIRVSQSYIVNLKYIKSVERTEITLDNGTIIVVSAKYKQEFKEEFIRFLGDKI